MNKIYKVIWSKAKHTYVVASEIAKGHTKGETTGKGLKKLAAAMLVAAALMGPNFAWAADTVTVTDPTTSTTVEVYTKDAADTQVNAAKTYTYRKVAAEEKAREAADTELNERITNEANGIHDEIKAGDEKLDARITNVKEYLENQTVSKTDAAVQDGAIVKADKTIGENVTNLDAALAKETAARIGADKAQDAVIQQVNQNAANGIATLATAYNNEVASREAADNELNERITNEANAIHETTNQLQNDLNTETAAREAGDTALDTRITNVKEYLEKQTSDKYVSKDDAAVQDGAIVKAANTIGENVTNLDAALAKETADRLGADKAQDKVIQQVNQNMVDGFNIINKNVADGFTALNNADLKEAQERAAADTALDDKITAETSARVAADTKLVEAVNSGLSLSNDNVLQKNTTTIDAQGNVTTSKTDAKEMILNKGKDNQITLNENGIKVGTNSTVVDKDGVYTGGDTYSEAKAAMSADGKIKGANGAFTVDENGNVASKATITGETVTDGKGASMSNGTVTGKTLTDGIATITNGNINTSGTITGGTVTSTGNISAVGDIHAGGAITGASASIQGALTAGSATITGDLTAGGAIQGKSISDGTATMQNGNITGVKNLSAETITTSGDATIGGDLTVNGKLNVDEIDLTKNGIVGDNNVTASTKVAAGEITSYKKATSTKDGSEKESAIDYDENGTSTWAKATDADGNWNKSTLTVEGNDVTSKVIDSDKNSNTSTQTASESNSTITGTADGKNYKSYITQNLKNILQGIKEGTNESIVDQTETGIKSTATDGKNTASTNLSNNGFNTYASDGTNKTYTKQTAESLTSQIGDDGKVKSVMNADGITNNADGGTITNSAKDLVNKATGNMTNTVGGKLLNDVTGDMENKVGGNLTTTVTGKVTEDFKSDLTTTIGGNKSEDVKGTSTETVTGKKTENYNGGLETTVTGEEKHTVNGSQTTKVNGDQSTTVTGKQTNSITGDQVNTIGGNQTTTVTGKVTEDYKSDLDTKVGGNQTTTVTGDSSLSAKNITNTASEKIANQIGDGSAVKSEMTADGITNTAEGGTIYNKSKDILNEVSGDILNFADGEIGNSANKITNLTGDNTVTSDTNGTTFENKAHSKAIEEGSVTKTTISGNTLETGKATMDYAEVMKDLGVHGNATVDKKLTVKGDSDLQGNATVGKDLEVKGSTKLDGTLKVVGKSTFKDDVTMEKNLDVKGTTTTDKLVVNNGATVTGGTTTDTLKVTGSSEFDGKATFNDIVTMNKGLSVTGGVTADTVTAYSYKVGDKTYIDKDGINANNQVIRNVGQGNISEGSTDAVSGGQLYETNTRVSGLETRMGTVETRVDKLDGKIDKVGANAAAMANLHPLEFDEDSKWNVAAAVGSSGSETASAVGVFYRPNENVMVNASAAMGTGENMFGGGVSLRLGHGGNKAKEAQMKAAAAENKELRAKVDDLTARMDALLSVLNPNMSKDFPDVPENHWAYEAVSRLAGNGIVEGYEDGKYHGERQMTRYEMAEIIYNTLSKGAKAEKKLVEEFRPELQAMAAQKKA